MSRPVRRLALRPPPGAEAVPDFDGGWLRPDGSRDAYLRYAGEGHAVNWSVELEELHAESSRDHYIDAWTRAAILERSGPLPAGATIADVGCSTGFLLEDLRSAQPDAQLLGVDLVESGLRAAHRGVPDATLLQADVCALPLADASVDAIVSANLLEHVPADVAALVELHRVLRSGARAVLVVPVGPGLYDYYDRYLGHERRYARGELSAKARRAGFEIVEDIHLGSILFPAFWVAKQRNRRRRGQLQGAALAARVAADIAATRDSRVGRLACQIERLMLRGGLRLPFGIRGLTVVRRPEGEA